MVLLLFQEGGGQEESYRAIGRSATQAGSPGNRQGKSVALLLYGLQVIVCVCVCVSLCYCIPFLIIAREQGDCPGNVQAELPRPSYLGRLVQEIRCSRGEDIQQDTAREICLGY